MAYQQQQDASKTLSDILAKQQASARPMLDRQAAMAAPGTSYAGATAGGATTGQNFFSGVPPVTGMAGGNAAADPSAPYGRYPNGKAIPSRRAKDRMITRQNRLGLRKYLSTTQGPTRALGYSNLADILASKGHIDPAALNLQIAGIRRGTEANQQGFQGSLAESGLQNSGVGRAIGAAIGQSGVEQVSQAQAAENAAAAERYRKDLELYNMMVNDPALKAEQLNIERARQREEAKNMHRQQVSEHKDLARKWYGSVMGSMGKGQSPG